MLHNTNIRLRARSDLITQLAHTHLICALVNRNIHNTRGIICTLCMVQAGICGFVGRQNGPSLHRSDSYHLNL